MLAIAVASQQSGNAFDEEDDSRWMRSELSSIIRLHRKFTIHLCYYLILGFFYKFEIKKLNLVFG